MNISAGKILISTSSADDPDFGQAIIFITEHNQKGAMGFVINKQFTRPLNELAEFSHGIAFPLYEGGPVDKAHLYFIHRRPDLIQDGTLIAPPFYFGGNFKKAVAHINRRTLQENDIKIFIGYCGWDDGQLEQEIKEGSWSVADAAEHNIFAAL